MNRTTLTVFVTSLLAAASVTLVTTPRAAAQDKPGMKMGSKMAGHDHESVYACDKCKVYMSPAAAKKMGGKDAMGHMMMKMDKAPEGYKMASMKMGGKMMGHKMGMDGGKMKMGSRMKMSGPVYVCPECKTFMSEADAMKMGGKDAMGHMMKKMGKAPAGFMDASKMKMGGKM